MRRFFILILAGLFLLAGSLLFVASFAKIGINDGEWSIIAKSGSFSTPSALMWTKWRPNDGSVSSFRHFRPEEEPRDIIEFRTGRAHGFLFDFTFYEGKFHRGDAVMTVPALGPGWGASYHYEWMFGAFAIGMVLVISHFVLRRRRSGESTLGLHHAHEEV